MAEVASSRRGEGQDWFIFMRMIDPILESCAMVTNKHQAENSALDELVAEICEYLLKGELALFCGAGISKNSGLPLVDELKRSILETLLETKQDIKQVMKVPYPFEAFLQAILDPSLISGMKLDSTKILEIFRQGEPNSNHVFIARLAKNGFVKTVATTNFDLLIEKALQNEGWEGGINFDRYYTEESFSEAEPAEHDIRFSLFKLHGSIDHPETVRATLSTVASQSLSKQRMLAINHLFSTGTHKAILVIGYSCSDIFDLIPQIQSIDTDYKQVFFIDHIEGIRLPTVYDLDTQRKKNPFIHFPGRWIKWSADELIKDLWSTVGESIGKYEFIRTNFNWRSDASAWLGEVQKDLGAKYFTAGHVLENIQMRGTSHIQLFDKARFYFERALEFAKENKDAGAMMACNTEIGDIYSNWRDSANHAIPANIHKAIEYHQKALSLAEDLPDEISESYAASFGIRLGLDYGSIKKFDIANDWLEKSRRRSRGMPDTQKIDAKLSSSYVAFGVTRLEEKKPAEALEYFKKAFSHEDREDGQQISLNCGTAFLRLRRFDQAMSCYHRSEAICKEKGDLYTLNEVYKSLSDAYLAIRNTERSEHYRQKHKLTEARMRSFH
jgi:tetratricopeptide (TPR) repeat protein/NAD-dependent SIR2 family protein deacetylase